MNPQTLLVLFFPLLLVLPVMAENRAEHAHALVDDARARGADRSDHPLGPSAHHHHHRLHPQR